MKAEAFHVNTGEAMDWKLKHVKAVTESESYMFDVICSSGYLFHSEPLFNPLSPHDALKHHFTSLKTDLIFLQLRV